MFQELLEKNQFKALVRCVELMGLKNPNTVEQISDNEYRHTNSRGRTRTFKVFSTCKQHSNFEQSNKLHKVMGYYIAEIES